MSEAEKLVEQGNRSLEKGDFKGAMTRFNKAVKLDPDCAEAHFGKAEASVGVPKLSLVDVAGFYRRAIELAPDNPFYLTAYGEFCLSHGLLPQAEQQYEKAAEVDPDNTHLYFSDLAIGYFVNGLEFLDRQLDMTEEKITSNALHYYMKAFGLDRDGAMAVLDLVGREGPALTRPDDDEVKKECGELEKGGDGEVKELMEALRDEPNNPMTLLSLGQRCLERKLCRAGIDYFLRAVEMDEENAPFFFNDLSASIYSCYAGDGGKRDEKELGMAVGFALHSLGYLEADRARELLEGREGK